MHMKRQIACFIISIGIACLAYPPSQAEWSEPIPVTTDTTEDEYPTAVVSDGTRLWAAWYSCGAYWEPAAIKVSYFDGNSWSSPQVISQHDELVATPPAMTKDTSDNIWVAWYYGSWYTDKDEQPQQEDWGIYTTTYDGYSWSAPELAVRACTSGMGGVLDQAMETDRPGRLCLSWSAQENVWGLWVSSSVYLTLHDGSNWLAPVCIAQGWGCPDYPTISYWDVSLTPDDSTELWLSFTRDSVDWGYVGYTICTSHYAGDEGASGSGTIATLDPSNDWDAVIANDGQGKVWLVWVSDRDGNANIYSCYRNGDGWRDTVAITTDEGSDSQPSVGIDLYGWVWVAWTSNRDGDPNIYVSYNCGTGWSAEERVTSDTTWDDCAYIVSDESGTIWVLWTSYRNGNYDIYSAYTTVRGVEERVQEGPGGFRLFGSYPNPFNSHTEIRYQILEPGLVSLEVYNLLGQLVRTLIQGGRESGHHSVFWNGRDEENVELPSGVYFYRIEAAGRSQAKKLLLLR